MKITAKSYGGKCLSPSYLGLEEKLLWECAEGHQWESEPRKVRRGSWCPQCSIKRKRKNQRLTVEALTYVASIHDGVCLSKKYTRALDKYLWQCSERHQWEATYNNISRGTWCPYCAGKKQSIEDIHQIARDRGGRCISNKYKSMKGVYEWKCGLGHTWKAMADSVKRGSWCPVCNSRGFGERIVREYIEQMTGRKFPSSYPKWLVSDDGYQMELDGYCKKLNLAFEHQGVQHDSEIAFFHRQDNSFDKQLNRDKVKSELCRQNGVALIKVPQLSKHLQTDGLYDFLSSELQKNGVEIKKAKDKIKLDLKKVYTPDYLTKLRNILEKNDGQLVGGDIASYDNKITLKCNQDHEWTTTIEIILNDHWCPACAGRPKLTIDDCIITAKERGGKCLTNIYKNASTKMKWRCKYGHTWESTYGNIRVGKWCPKCAGTQRLTIEACHKIAASYGGKCLSDTYTNANTKYRWQCAKKHDWEATYANVYSGKWCAKCRHESTASKLRKYSIEDMQAYAKKHEGECLSTEYLSTNKTLKWRCENGHVFQNSWDNIKRGQWCKKCTRQQ